jgi:hypothetical protein
MFKDPIVEEIRKNRDNHAKKFNYDLKLIIADLRKKQEKNIDKVVSFPPKKYYRPTGS